MEGERTGTSQSHCGTPSPLGKAKGIYRMDNTEIKSLLAVIQYGDFSRLAKKRGWTMEMLVELFKGKIGIEDRSDKYHEPLASYFERLLSRRWLNPQTRRIDDRSNVVIAYRPVIEFYLKELHAAEVPIVGVEQAVRRNRHGGHRQGAGRKKLYASEAER